MNKYENYLGRREELRKGIEWNELPNGKRYMHDKFEISVVHCSIKLQRAGQQYQGGTNYWDSPKALNSAILKIIKSDPSIIDRAIDILKKASYGALLECEGFATELLEKVQIEKESTNE